MRRVAVAASRDGRRGMTSAASSSASFREVNSRVAGVSHAQEVVEQLEVGEVVEVVPEPDNAFDARAQKVVRRDGQKVGYLPRETVSGLGEGRVTRAVVEYVGRRDGVDPETGLQYLMGVRLAMHVEAGEGGRGSSPSPSPPAMGPYTGEVSRELEEARDRHALAALARVNLRPRSGRVKLALDAGEQRTPAWHKMRVGKVTASAICDALGAFPDVKDVAEVEIKPEYVAEAEALTPAQRDVLFSTRGLAWARSVGICEKFKGNQFTRHGQSTEAEALEVYCRLTGNKVTHQSFATYWDPDDPATNWLGASPDGLILREQCENELFRSWMNGDGLIEIKCPAKGGIKGNVPWWYVPQIVMQMEVLNREWVDFVQFVPASLSDRGRDEMSIWRVERQPKAWEDLLVALYDYHFGSVVPAMQEGLSLAEKLSFAPDRVHPMTDDLKQQFMAISRGAVCWLSELPPPR